MASSPISPRTRHFENPYAAFPDPTDSSDASQSVTALLALERPERRAKIIAAVSRKLRNIVRDDPPAPIPRNVTVHSGHAGYALLFLRAYESYCQGLETMGFEREQLLYIAENYIDGCLMAVPQTRKGCASTFLTGSAGIYAVALVILSALGRHNEQKRYIRELLALSELCQVDRESENALTQVPDEVMYGSAGYLFSLLFIYARREKLGIELPSDFVPTMRRLFDTIVQRGVDCAVINANAGVSLPPLVWVYHNQPYLGAAHGAAGILLILLQTLQLTSYFDGTVKEQETSLIWNSIDALRQHRFTHGNYPSKFGSMEDDLVQICHGAPGVLLLLARAMEMTEVDAGFQADVMSSAVAVWMRGLLTKGNSLCHGTAGNAYAFEALYRATKLPAYQLAAEAFTREILDESKRRQVHPSDRHLSLWEGKAGEAYFMLNACGGDSYAGFPGLEV